MSQTPFSSLARVYDAIFADVEYQDWCDFVLETVQHLGWLERLSNQTMLDVACGTGNSLKSYFERGFLPTGTDSSQAMLEVARQKFGQVRFIQQGFLELHLKERFSLITCVFDSLNNLLEVSDLHEALRRIKAHLAPNGVFAFDCNTPLGVRELWEDDEFVGDVLLLDGSAHFHWTHRAISENTGEVTAHVWRMDDNGAVVEEINEVHVERGYTPTELEEALLTVGFLEVRLLEYPDGAEVDADTPRFWGFAR